MNFKYVEIYSHRFDRSMYTDINYNPYPHYHSYYLANTVIKLWARENTGALRYNLGIL